MLQDLVVADTHDTLLLFTDRGRVFHLRSFNIAADTSRTSRGTPIVNLVKVAEGERVNAIVAVPDLVSDHALVMGTRKGAVKRIRLKDLANIRSPGLRAINLKAEDELVSVRLGTDDQDVMMFTERGQGVRFPLVEVPQRSRAAGSVRGIRLAQGDKLVGMEVVQPDDNLLVVTRNGYGKLVPVDRFRGQHRGGLGLRTYKTGPKVGLVSAARVVNKETDEELLLVSAQCQVFRTSLNEISSQGRITQGVIIWKPDDEDEVVSLACVPEKSRDGEANGAARSQPGNGRNGSPKNGGGGDK